MTALHWDALWRERTVAALDQPWDLIVVGGGIAGAGVLRAAARAGLRSLLLEQRDFGWGASSRSSQLVHGGLRYLAKGQVRTAARAVAQRESLLRELPGLVSPLPFVVPLRREERARRAGYRATIGLYEVLAGRTPRLGISAPELALRAPTVHRDGVSGALAYAEGRTDDARLVLRVLREAAAGGAVALNAVEVSGLVHRAGRVAGVQVRDRLTAQSGELAAAVVVNATGSWSDRLRRDVAGPPRMRPVRGSHLLFPAWRFPLHIGVNVRSPRDGRHVSVLPWEGATLVGTTDLDHHGDLAAEPAITADEVGYLLECVTTSFPSLELTAADVLSTWSGVRPVVSTGAARSGDERREHVVWDEQGMLTATGGKLTTFQVLADDVLAAARPRVSSAPAATRPPLRAAQQAPDRLSGRFGTEAAELAGTASADEREPIGGTSTTWAEVRWSARREAVTGLADLMLRRTRLGLLLPRGGEQVLDDVRAVCRDELGWDAARWERERADYTALVRDCYAVPPGTRTVSAAGSTSTVTGSGPTGSPSA
jgi:glycerol-3-phosphate dehydrogenase